MPRVSPAGTLSHIAINIRSSFWFVPGLMVLASIALSLGLMELDQRIDRELLQKWPRLFVVQAEGSRAMLSTIAGSMITVAGVVFSVTIVALAQASSQYTSRVLRNFMRDRANQTVLGVFLGVFSYCLVVLRNISEGNGDAAVPFLAVMGGLILALAAIGFLIFFIHHIATTIQAEEITSSITRDTLQVVERLFPQGLGEEVEEVSVRAEESGPGWHQVPSRSTGYIQSANPESLLRFSRQFRTTLRMVAGVGEFVHKGQPLAMVALPGPPDESMLRKINSLYSIDSFRTTDQDAAFGIRQLVDIALKALSPGINDTTTAVICLQYLSAILRDLAPRRLEKPCLYEGQEPRLITCGPSFRFLVHLAFDQILESAEGNTVVLLQLLKSVVQVCQETASIERRRVLDEVLDSVEEIALRGARSRYSCTTIREHLALARQACSERGA